MTRNNSSLEKTYNLLKNLPGKTIIVNLGDSINYECLTIPFTNYADCANKICKTLTGWILWCYPGEYLLSNDEFELDDTSKIYAIHLVRQNVLLRPARLWHQPTVMPTFVNPVYEDNGLEPTAIVPLYFENFREVNEEDLLVKWQKAEPHNNKVNYYLAMSALMKNNIRKFKQESATYLFSAKEVTDSVIMIWYYLSLIDEEKALDYVALGIMHKPWMAEFWCRAAQIFLKRKQHGRATALYENALLFGQRRPGLDNLPIELNKYKKEPEDFIELIKTNILERQSLHLASEQEKQFQPLF